MNTENTFLWGAAASSHQVEGNNTLNDWWDWESRGKVKEPSGIACDHYNRFGQDFKIAHSLGHTAHRFSLEWSRLEPEEGRWSAFEWAHYKEVVRTLRALKIEPIVTLNHFTLPLWFYKNGGWTDRRSILYFARFAKKAVDVLGEDVTYWLTLNEPFVYAFMAYIKGVWPPGESSCAKAFMVIENQIQAHASAYKDMHEAARKVSLNGIKVGAALSVSPFFPCREESPGDRLAVFLRNNLYNHMFIRSALNGIILFPGFHIRALRSRRAADFIGLNYYSYENIRYKGLGGYDMFGEPCYLGHHEKANEEKNSLGWRVYPEGVYLLLKDFAGYGLPIIITENGICTNDDNQRSIFIKDHLSWVFKARSAGIPAAGYLYWSLLDNFEWADGYSPRFGLIETDYTTLTRTVRPSGRIMADYIADYMKAALF